MLLSCAAGTNHFGGSAAAVARSDPNQAIVGLKNGCTIAMTCARVSGSSNASLAAVAAPKLLAGMFGSVAAFKVSCVVLSSPA